MGGDVITSRAGTQIYLGEETGFAQNHTVTDAWGLVPKSPTCSGVMASYTL